VIVSLTVLGGRSAPGATAIGRRIVDYLEGGRTVARAGRHPGSVVEVPAPEGGTLAYYADSAGTRPGRWALGHDGEVDRGELVQILSGIDPATGQPLLTARGTRGGAARSADAHAAATDDETIRASTKEWWSASETAGALGVSARYARRLLAKRHNKDPFGIEHDERGAWQVRRDILATIADERVEPRVVAGYDLTFSAPKSVSLLWAVADDPTRAEILHAIDEAVAAGLRYAERHALRVRVLGQDERAEGVIAADYLHTTSRALEPQLHHHVVIANFARGSDGEGRALDARHLFHHAQTIGYLSAAALRHELAGRLGVAWSEPIHGVSDLVGVPERAIAAMSSRSNELHAELERLGLIDPATGVEVASAAQRQVAAWDTRAEKVHGVDVDALFTAWDARLAEVGFDEAARATIANRDSPPALFAEEDRVKLFDGLVRVAGITEHEAVFDRRTVVRAIATAAVDRLSGDAIDALADAFLARSEVVRLHDTLDRGQRDVIRLRDGRAIAVPTGARYSTRAMLNLEARALGRYERGRTARLGVVPLGTLSSVLADERFSRLSDEQREFVTRLVTSGLGIQAGVGAAGTGKTTALHAAVTAWEAAGFTVLGTAVGGRQTVKLAKETGIATSTVASILARVYDHDDRSLITRRTVILLDEASQLSTHDFVLLADAAANAGAALRLIGDPAQHSSVAAGGLFRYLVEHEPNDTPRLTHIYRQQGPEMAEVRLANVEFRERMFAAALDRLERDGRITEAETAEEAYDLLVCAWYAEREKRLAEPTRDPSSMTAEFHRERAELNARARALLKADGTLTGPALTVGSLEFQRGDEVIARVGNRRLRADGAARTEWVRNGSLGVVAEVDGDHLTVAFDDSGRVEVPRTYLEQRLSGGIVGGLQYAYALTTHAAEGETYSLAVPLISDASSPEGTYVSVTRGRLDLQAVAVRHRAIVDTNENDSLPRLAEDVTELDATTRRLETSEPERLATELDGLAARAAEMATTYTLSELAFEPSDESDVPLLAIARSERARRVGLGAIVRPDPATTQHLGSRPGGGVERVRWDRAVSAAAIWRERERVTPDEATPLGSVIGVRPEDPTAATEYDKLVRLIHQVTGEQLAATLAEERAVHTTSTSDGPADRASPDPSDEPVPVGTSVAAVAQRLDEGWAARDLVTMSDESADVSPDYMAEALSELEVSPAEAAIEPPPVIGP
jgi:conjugative relaxase-like TrwC/TraI family protein